MSEIDVSEEVLEKMEAEYSDVIKIIRP